MSSATLSSSPGPSNTRPDTKRPRSNNRESDADDGRISKRSRTTSEEPSSAKHDAKDKKKRHKRKKRKVSVVVEDGRARFKDSRRGVSQLPLSPVKVSELSCSRSIPAVLANDKSKDHNAEDPVSSSNDKGKGKAVEPGPSTAEEQIARLTKELAFKNDLIEKHQNAVIQTQQAITCQVCLELMYKPYALSPCGHLTCYECLVSWFKATPEDRPAPTSVVLRKKTCPHCRAAITDRPVQVWGIKSIVGSFSKNGLLQGNFLPPDESSQNTTNANENADPWDGIFRKAGHLGHGFEVEQLMMDEIMGGGAGILDDEDGGVYRCYDCLHEIWDGVCSNCGRLYPNVDEDADDDFELEHELDSEGEEDDDIDDDGMTMEWMLQPEFHRHLHRLGVGRGGEPQPRDVSQEIHARLVEIEAERAAEEGREPDIRGVDRFYPRDDDDEDEDEDEEEEYEGSFIDDGDDVGIPRLEGTAAEIIELSSGSDDDEEDFAHRRQRFAPILRGGGAGAGAPNRSSPIEVNDGEEDSEDDDDKIQEVRRNGRSRHRSGPIVILSDSDNDEDDDDENPASSSSSGRSRATRKRKSTRIDSTDDERDSDSEDDGIDPNLADRVAAEELEMYGEDDSIPRRSRRQEDEDEDLEFAILD